MAGLGLLLWVCAAWVTVSALSKPFPGLRIGWCATVSDVNDPAWAGIRAGVRPGDLVTQVDRIWVYSGPEVWQGVAARPLGAPFSIEAIGLAHPRAVRFEHPAEPLPPSDAWRHFGPDFVLDLLLLGSGAWLAWWRPHQHTAWAAFILLWGLGASLVLSVDYDLSYLFPPGTLYAVRFLTGASILALAINFPRSPQWLRDRPWLQALPWAFALAPAWLVALIFTWRGPSHDAEGLGTTLTIAWTTLALAVGVALFVRRRGQALPGERRPWSILLLGVVVCFWPAQALELLGPQLWEGPVPWSLVQLSHGLWVAFPLALAYALEAIRPLKEPRPQEG